MKDKASGTTVPWSLFTVSKDDLGRVLLHVPLGILTCALWYVHWALAVVFAAGFIIYEKEQDKYTIDQAWKDIKGFLWGLGLTGSVLFVLKLLGII